MNIWPFTNKKLCCAVLIMAVAAGAYGAQAIISAFNTGEVTEELGGRVDIRKYYSACRLLENFYCQAEGGVSKRQGTYYINSINDSNYRGRLITFERSIAVSNVLEFGNETIQVYK